jgi:predicted RNase H-like nuclease
MAWIAGVDGCKRGWFRVCRCSETGALAFHVIEAAAELCRTPPRPEVIGLDIPIGLTDAGRRECDCAARKRLGWPRRNSVFPAPIRPALKAKTRVEAAEITCARDGRRVSAQAWALYPKIREVDAWLRTSPDCRARVREVHPEVSFWAMRDGRAFEQSKKTRPGRAARQKLIERWLGRSVLADARDGHLKKHVADDDILDAFAALWTAERIHAGRGVTLPEDAPRDSVGLRMEIVY